MKDSVLAKLKQPKAIALGVMIVAAACVAAFCLGGDEPTAASRHAQYTIWEADLTHDGQDEQIIWDGIAFASTQFASLYIQTAASKQLVSEDFLWESPLPLSSSYVGATSYSLYQDASGDYLWQYQETWQFEIGSIWYELFYLSAEGEKIVVDSDELIILTDKMVFDDTLNDVDAVLAFYETVCNYATASYVLVSTLPDINYLDITTGETIIGTLGTSLISSTEAAPVRIDTVFIPACLAPQDERIPTEGSVTEILRAQLAVLNEKRAAAYCAEYCTEEIADELVIDQAE